MSISSKLSYVLSRLQGYSENTFRIYPNGSTTAVANQTVHFTLPNNSYVDMRSFKVFADASISSATNQGRLPNGISTLIERVEVRMGGVMVQSGCNEYNQLKKIKNYLSDKTECHLLGHPYAVRAVSNYLSSGIASNKEVATTYCFQDFEGFLNSCEPRIINTGLVGDVIISITFAVNSVCIDASGTTFALFAAAADGPAPVYNLANLYATIKCCGFADGSIAAIEQQIIASKGYLEVPFKNYIQFTDNTASQMKFSLATQSLDRVFITAKAANDYNSAGGANLVEGYLSGATTIATEANMDNFKEVWTTRYLSNKELSATMKLQLQMNGALVPQYQANVFDLIAITKEACPKWKNNDNLLAYRAKNWVVAFPFSLDADNVRAISGMDTRGISLNAFLNFTNVPGTDARPVMVFCETTATLHIGTSHQIDVLL